MKRVVHLGLVIVLLLMAIPFAVRAQTPGVYKLIIEKQEEKKRSRWTLADWLTQKQQMRAQDMWLAKNSHSSPYEFYLDGSSRSYKQSTSLAPDTEQSFIGQSAELGAYAGPAGLRGVFSSNEEKQSMWQGGLNLRIYGRAIQDTHINLEWGLRGESTKTPTEEKFQNQFGAVNLDLYLTKNFGIGGRYARILPAQSDLKTRLEGEDSSARVFIDFWAVQIFGEWRHEFSRKTLDNAGTLESTTETRTGFGGGLRLFF